MRKFREDFKEMFEHLDWLNSLPDDERWEYIQSHSMVLKEGQEDPTIIYLKEGETVEEWMKENNYIDATEIIERLKNA